MARQNLKWNFKPFVIPKEIYDKWDCKTKGSRLEKNWNQMFNSYKKKYPKQFITYPVSESLMNSSCLGLALAGKRIVMIHVRIDFLASGMCALVNHIPVWYKKGFKLPITLFCCVNTASFLPLIE